MRESRIHSIAYYLPSQILSNADLAAIYPGWDEQKIYQKTGIKERRIADQDETATDMAIKAAYKIFANKKISPSDIDFIIFCTQAPDYFLPTSACIIQDRLGIPTSAGAVDINLGCSGFVYALSLANGLIACGAASTVLILTADTYSKFIHPMDKSVRTLFGDAATATVVCPADSPRQSIKPFVFGTDGAGAKHLIVEAGASRMARSDDTAKESEDSSGNVRSRNNLYMDGGAVLSFTLREIPPLVDELIARAEITKDNIDVFVLHQANTFILNALRKKMSIDENKFAIHLENVGNTVSSTIPIVLAEMDKKGILINKRIALVGFGVGLSWAACLLNT